MLGLIFMLFILFLIYIDKVKTEWDRVNRQNDSPDGFYFDRKGQMYFENLKVFRHIDSNGDEIIVTQKGLVVKNISQEQREMYDKKFNDEFNKRLNEAIEKNKKWFGVHCIRLPKGDHRCGYYEVATLRKFATIKLCCGGYEKMYYKEDKSNELDYKNSIKITKEEFWELGGIHTEINHKG